MKILFVSLLFLFAPFAFAAQKHFEPGYIINLENDTIKGLINNENKFKSPDSILFRMNPEDPQKIFFPFSIKGFSVADVRYVSATIPSEVLIRAKTPEQPINPGLKPVFLLVVAEGSRNLYCYSDEKKNAYFFTRDSSGYDFLIYKEYDEARYNNKGEYVDKILKRDNKFIGQLMLYFQDCPQVQVYLQGATYNEKSLKSIYKRYYTKCNSNTPHYIKSNPKINFHGGIMAGLSNSSVKFETSLTLRKITTDCDYSTSSLPSVGLFGEMTLPYNHGRWSIKSELYYNAVESKGTVETLNSAEYFSLYYNTFNMKYLGIHLFIKYAQPIGKITLFADIGARINYMLEGKHTLVVEGHYYGDIVKGPSDQTIDILNTEKGLAFGLGAQYGRFYLQGRLNYSIGFTNYSGFTSTLNQFNTVLGYRIF